MGELQAKSGTGLNLALEFAAALPVGRAESLGRDTCAVNPKLQLGVQGEHFQAGVELGALLRPSYDLSSLTRREQDVVGSELRLGTTVTSRGPTAASSRPEVSLLLNVPLHGGRPSAEVLVGVRRHTVKGLDVYFLRGPGLGTAVDMPAVWLRVGASFVTGKAD